MCVATPCTLTVTLASPWARSGGGKPERSRVTVIVSKGYSRAAGSSTRSPGISVAKRRQNSGSTSGAMIKRPSTIAKPIQ
jgi:hypothetical protein